MNPWDADFEFVRKLGEGWAGTAWLCRIRSPSFGMAPDDLVALKVYKPAIFNQAINIAARIEREAEIGRQMNHPNLVRVLGLLKRHEPGGIQNWALAMEYCEGGDLSGNLSSRPKCGVQAILAIVRGLARGLAALHDRDVIHRDIKPENILFDRNGVPKIGDFGVIRHLDEATMTGATEFLGTIRYAAPEVLRAKSATQSSDVYSLGTVLYQLLRDERPYDDDELFSMVVASVLASPPAMSVGETLPEEGDGIVFVALEAICSRMLRSVPEERPHAHEVLGWLEDPTTSPPFVEALSELIGSLMRQNMNLARWCGERRREPTIFNTYAAWRVASIMSGDDALRIFRTRAPEIISGNERYLEVAMALAPQDDEYKSLPRAERMALARAIKRHQKGWVHEIYDEHHTIESRDKEYKAYVDRLRAIETDEAIGTLLGSIDYCARGYWNRLTG